MSGEGAFVRLFQAEMKAAAHDRLVETYVWANRMDYGSVPVELRERGEEWARRIEDAGKTWEVLEALARVDDE